MQHKFKPYAYAIAIAIMAIIAWIYFSSTNRKSPTSTETSQLNTAGSGKNETQKEVALPSPLDLEIQGTLRVSDNTSKGNFMVVTKNEIVYIKTSRNYSQLVDKPVVVSGRGTPENFQFDDIRLDQK